MKYKEFFLKFITDNHFEFKVITNRGYVINTDNRSFIFKSGFLPIFYVNESDFLKLKDFFEIADCVKKAKKLKKIIETCGIENVIITAKNEIDLLEINLRSKLQLYFDYNESLITKVIDMILNE